MARTGAHLLLFLEPRVLHSSLVLYRGNLEDQGVALGVDRAVVELPRHVVASGTQILLVLVGLLAGLFGLAVFTAVKPDVGENRVGYMMANIRRIQA